MRIVALDVDLKKIYAVTNDGKVLAKAEPDRTAASLALAKYDPELVLIEVASPVMYVASAGAIHNVIRWSLWNITTAEYLASKFKVLVAPSHVWTRGHNLKVRHDVAKCTQKQKDLRECEAMMYYYQANPTAWLPLPQYLGNL